MADARSNVPVNLVFSGQCVAGHDPLVVRRAVAMALKLDERRAARLFSGKHIVLKRQVDTAYAVRQIARFAAMGAVLRTEPALRAAAGARPVAGAADAAGSAGFAAAARATRQSVQTWWLAVPRRRAAWGAGLAGLAGGLALLLGGAGLWASLQSGSASDASADPVSGRNASTSAVALKPSGALPAVAMAAAAPIALAEADWPQRLSTAARQDYQRLYLPQQWHKAFAVAASGAHVWVVGAASEALAREAVLLRCAQAQQSVASGCRVVDVDGEPQE